MDSLLLQALGRIKGVAEAGETFAPAAYGLAEREVAELLGCGAVQVAAEGATVAPEGAAAAAPAKTAASPSARKAAK